MSKGYLANKDTGVATFQVTQNSPTAHSVIIGAGHLLADFTKSGKTWKVKVFNDTDTVLSVPQNTSGVTKYAHIIVKIDNSVNPNAVKSNVASFVSVPLTTATPTAGDIQAVIGAGMDFYSLGYVTQVNNNAVITNAMITNQSTKVTLSKAIDIPSTNVVYASGYFSGTTYPASPFVGQWFYKTSAPIGQQFWNGSAWTLALTSADAPTKSDNFTANGAISAKDAVYITSNDTVKSLIPTGMTTGSTLTTARTSVNATKSLPLSTSGLFLHITGGTTTLGRPLTAQVCTMNAAETDFSNGTEAIIYNTSNGVRGYDVVQIGTDKFMFIFQADTGGAGGGVRTVVCSISGTTITVGSIQTIETTGSLTFQPAVAKLNTDKACIFYMKDSDGDIYAQVLSVSGTTISTNTTYLVKAIAGTAYMCADQLGTDSAILIYSNTSDGTNIYGRTISVSGTTITVNAENTLKTVGGVGTLGWRMAVRTISSNKCLFVLAEPASTNDLIHNIAISGTTLTLSSSLAWITQHVTEYYGIAIISSKFALVAGYTTNTSMSLYFIDISGTAPTAISNQSFAISLTSNLSQGVAVVKVAPWTYVIDAYPSDADFLVKLIPASSAHVGVAEADIANAGVGAVLKRYQRHSLWSGLTAGAKYYVDDNSRETVNTSLTAPLLGIALNATDIQLQ
jgi:hypothetical protein